MRKNHPWTNRGVDSNRIIVKGQSRREVEKRVSYHKGKGFVPLMDVKPDYTFQGEPMYVCVMERKTKSPSA